MDNKKYYKWVYKIINSGDIWDVREGELVTNYCASKICKYFETIGWEVGYLNRVCEIYDEAYYKTPLHELIKSINLVGGMG